MFFRSVFITKENKEKMKLKAIKQVLTGIKNLEKSYYVEDAWKFGSVAICKDYLVNRFGDIETAAKCLTEKIEASPITSEEREMLSTIDYKVQAICVDDIKYTFHGKYIDYLGVSFTKAERMRNILQSEKKNPSYYTKDLKDPNYVRDCDDPIEIFLKEDENGNNYGTIHEGNNRILKLKCDMAYELSQTVNKEEIQRIRDKYTIYTKVKDVKDLELTKGVTR